MFSKSVFVFAFLAVAKLAVATPPACLLAAINTQDDPSQVSKICGNSKMSGYISSACGDDTQQAMSAYSAVCKAAGVTVSSASSTASATGSKSKSASASESTNSDTASASVSGSTTGKATASGTGKSASVTATVKPSTSIVVFTSASYNYNCSCTKTAAFTSTQVSGPTGLSVATSATTTTTGGILMSTGAAGRMEMGGFAAMAGVVAGAFALL